MVPQIYIGFNFPGGLEGEWRLVLLYFSQLPPSSIEGINSFRISDAWWAAMRSPLTPFPQAMA